MKTFLISFFCCACLFSFAQSGISWGMGMNIASNASGNKHPRVVVDGSGNPMVLWGNSGKAMFSRWNGTAFTSPVMVNPMGMTIAEASWMGPDIASKGDTVYVVFKRTPEASDTNHVFCVHSYDGGVTFSPAVQIDFIADSISRFPTVTTDASGNPIIAYMKFDPGFGNARWVVVKSTDFGLTFSTDTKASGWNGPGSLVCDCCPGSIVSSGNTVAMLYRDNSSNIRDTWAGISTNGGNTFSAGMGVDQQNWVLNACPSSGPDAEIIGDTLYSVYMNGASGMNLAYYNKSSLSAGTGSIAIPLTGTISGLALQNYPRMSADGNAMAIAWKQTISSSSELPLLFTNNIAGGFPTTTEIVDMNDITNTDVVLKNGNIFVVWQDDNSGTVKYRTGTYSIFTSSNLESNTNPFTVYPNPVSDILKIKSSASFPFSYRILNGLGAEIMSGDSGMNSNSDLEIEMTAQSKGIYFIQIKTTNNTFTHKVIKQ